MLASAVECLKRGEQREVDRDAPIGSE